MARDGRSRSRVACAPGQALARIDKVLLRARAQNASLTGLTLDEGDVVAELAPLGAGQDDLVAIDLP